MQMTALHVTPKNKVLLRSLLTKIISISLIGFGLWEIGHEVYRLFFVYPQIPEQLVMANFEVTVFDQLIIGSVMTTVIGFIGAYFGLTLLIKPSHLVERVHLVFGGLLLLVSYLVSHVQVTSLIDKIGNMI